jgi:hypothetical protein
MTSDVSGRRINGKAMTSFAGSGLVATPEEELVWAMLKTAATDVGYLAARRIISKEGECSDWPVVAKRGSDGYTRVEAVKICGMRHIDDAQRLRHFWLEGAAQEWADLVGMTLPADEAFYRTLKTHAPKDL